MTQFRLALKGSGNTGTLSSQVLVLVKNHPQISRPSPKPTMSISNTGSKLVSLAAAVPLLVFFRDNVLSLCKVQGSSMEPTLKNGDILLIRKADFPILGRIGRRLGVGYKSDIDESLLDNNDNADEETKRRRLREYEFQHFASRENAGVWVRWPPSPVKGQIITYRSPDAYPPDLVIKRVIGVSGQVVSDDNIAYKKASPALSAEPLFRHSNLGLRRLKQRTV
jgi:signal peptidase I